MLATNDPMAPRPMTPSVLLVQLRADEGGLALLHYGGHVHAGGHLLPDPLDAPVHVPGAHQHGAQHQLLTAVAWRRGC